MEAPIRRCCNQRHWANSWECPNKDDPTVADPKPKKKEKAPPLAFDPILDRPDSKATKKSILEMRSRRKKPEKLRAYMQKYMVKYRARKAAERKAKREAEENEQAK